MKMRQQYRADLRFSQPTANKSRVVQLNTN